MPWLWAVLVLVVLAAGVLLFWPRAGNTATPTAAPGGSPAESEGGPPARPPAQSREEEATPGRSDGGKTLEELQAEEQEKIRQRTDRFALEKVLQEAAGIEDQLARLSFLKERREELLQNRNLLELDEEITRLARDAETRARKEFVVLVEQVDDLERHGNITEAARLLDGFVQANDGTRIASMARRRLVRLQRQARVVARTEERRQERRVRERWIGYLRPGEAISGAHLTPPGAWSQDLETAILTCRSVGPAELRLDLRLDDYALELEASLPRGALQILPRAGLGGKAQEPITLLEGAEGQGWVHLLVRVEGGEVVVTRAEREVSRQPLPELPERGNPLLRAVGISREVPTRLRGIFLKVLRSRSTGRGGEGPPVSLVPKGWATLFDGKDITYTWRRQGATEGWRVEKGLLVATSEGTGVEGWELLTTFQEFVGDLEVLLEVKGTGALALHPRISGSLVRPVALELDGDEWHRVLARVVGREATVLLDDEEVGSLSLPGTQGVVGIAFDRSRPTRLEIRVICAREVK